LEFHGTLPNLFCYGNASGLNSNITVLDATAL
jgi:hypothetical protein